MKTIVLLSCLFACADIYAQNFEGEIIYTIQITSKTKNFTGTQLETFIGNKQEYLIKDGNYKSFLNGQSVTLQHFDQKTNRIYNKTPKSDTLYWFDATTNTDVVESFEIKKNADNVLGNPCDAIIMKTKTGTTTIFYSSKYSLDSKLFVNHHYGNWAFFAEKTNALPLKTIVESAIFKMETTAIEIKPLELETSYFDIDPKIPIKKS